ncbi:MAG: Gfo/Idh/MocA family protein [Planctomycetota bacterium]
MQIMHRRTFLKGAVGLAGAAAAGRLSVATVRASVLGANERFRVAVCGLNGRGGNHVDGYLNLENVEIACLVDPDEKVLERALAGLRKKLARSPDDRGAETSEGEGEKRREEVVLAYEVQGVTDVRRALDDKTIDAISVATPNHWHSLMVVWAAQAGKHCYVEKPASHDVYEGRSALEAWKKYGVVVQHGTQTRSDAKVAGLHEAIHQGRFGRLAISYGYACKARGGIGFKPPSDPPPHLDWNIWRGPADVKQFHGNFVHYNWHWFWVTGNGELNNQGTHQLDVAYWAIDPDQTFPVRAMAIGGRFLWKDQGETPNTLFGIAQYPNGQWVFFNVRNVNHEGYRHQVENEYYFADGGKIARDRYYPKGSSEGEKIEVPRGKVTPGGPFGAFVAACRAGKPDMANGTMREAHRSCVLGHLMNISYRLGERVPFNEKAGRFGDCKEAYEHFMSLHALMRDGAGVPEDGEHYTVGPWLTFDPKTERFTGEHAERANALIRDPNRKGFEIPDWDKV